MITTTHLLCILLCVVCFVTGDFNAIQSILCGIGNFLHKHCFIYACLQFYFNFNFAVNLKHDILKLIWSRYDSQNNGTKFM